MLSTDGYKFWRDRKSGAVFATPRSPTEPEIWLSFYEEVSLFCHEGSRVIFTSPRPVDEFVRRDWITNGVSEISWGVYQSRKENGWQTCDQWETPKIRVMGAMERFYGARSRFLSLIKT